MICPNCLTDNVPGSDECSFCRFDLTQLDQPMGADRVERALMDQKIGSLQLQVPVTVPPTASVSDAVRAMLDHNLGAILVTQTDGRLVGIFSERDLLTKVAGLHDPCDALPVSRFMTADPETVSTDDFLAVALNKMDVGGYRHLPVLAHGLPAGVVSVRDVLRYVTRLCRPG